MFPDGEGLQEVRPEGDVQTSGVGCVTGRIHGLVIHQDAGEAAEGSAVRRIPADRKGQVLFGALGPFAAVPFGKGIDDIFIIFFPGTGRVSVWVLSFLQVRVSSPSSSSVAGLVICGLRHRLRRSCGSVPHRTLPFRFPLRGLPVYVCGR